MAQLEAWIEAALEHVVVIVEEGPRIASQELLLRVLVSQELVRLELARFQLVK